MIARRAGVLPGYPARGTALLEEPGLVDHQHGIGISKGFEGIVAHDLAQCLRIP